MKQAHAYTQTLILYVGLLFGVGAVAVAAAVDAVAIVVVVAVVFAVDELSSMFCALYRKTKKKDLTNEMKTER